MVTRKEWEQRLTDKLCPENIEFAPTKLWHVKNVKNFRLTDEGWHYFQKAQIPFHHFKVQMEGGLTTGTVLGLSRLPCPYYLDKPASKTDAQLYICNDEFAMYMYMLDNNIIDFAKTFIRRETE